MSKSTATIGVERHEAQEASAGDRRAITDADQAEQLDISGEAKTARTLRTPNHPQTLREWHTTRHTFHSEIGARSVLRVADEVIRTDEFAVNKPADTLPKFQTDYMFIQTVAESTTQPCITYVETRSGVVISFMCAWRGGYEDLTKEILRHFEACSSIRS